MSVIKILRYERQRGRVVAVGECGGRPIVREAYQHGEHRMPELLDGETLIESQGGEQLIVRTQRELGG